MSSQGTIPNSPRLTQAAFWTILVTRVEDERAIMESRWARGIFEQASVEWAPAGFAGVCWLFQDGSGVIAHPGEPVKLIPSRRAELASRN